MEKLLTLRQLADACGGQMVAADENLLVSDIVTDSRKVTKGSLFVALQGEKFDGHNFVKQVIESGAVCCVVNSDYNCEGKLPLIKTQDTYKALRDFAALYRAQFNIPSVAITGSVGKTSTKDMVAEVLMQHFNVLKTEGNFNNEIGLPLTTFGMKSENEIAVFEMGMSNFGEISRLSKIAAPETAIITNIGYSHIEYLGSRENILKAKLEILDGLTPGGTVILNGDDPYLYDSIGSIPYETLSYGIENTNCDICATNIRKSSQGTDFDVEIDGITYSVYVGVAGIHHVYNALSAILVGILYQMPVEEIIQGIRSFRPSGMRQNIVRLEKMVTILDCYNASPTSMKSGLEVLSVTKPKDESLRARYIAILGDMLELGDYAEETHRALGEMCCDYNLDCLIAIGPNSKYVAEGAISKGFNSSELYIFYDNNTVKDHLLKILRPNDVILFKGSRGMRLEEIAEFVAQNQDNIIYQEEQ